MRPFLLEDGMPLIKRFAFGSMQEPFTALDADAALVLFALVGNFRSGIKGVSLSSVNEISRNMSL